MKRIYKFAEIPIEIIYQYSYFLKKAADYECEYTPKYFISVDDNDIQAERFRAKTAHYKDGYLESLAIYRKVCNILINDKIILFHCSAVAVDGRAYLFAAPSGTGKSTHTALWVRLFGEKAIMINDDKPLLRLQDSKLYVYGTPWKGRANIGTNTYAEVAGICFINRDKHNTIKKITSIDSVMPRLLSQTNRFENPEKMRKTVEFLTDVLKICPIYTLNCNMELEAAQMAYATMKAVNNCQVSK